MRKNCLQLSFPLILVVHSKTLQFYQQKKNTITQNFLDLGPPWMEGGMRPGFNPRFDGPDEFFRGPPGGPLRPPGIFDEPHHPRHRRHDDRRRHRPDFDEEPGAERAERRSRWSSGSPRFEENFENSEQNNEEQNVPENEGNAEVQETSEDRPREVENVGNTTPLHDEPRDVQISEEVHEDPVQDSGNVEAENVAQESEANVETNEQNDTEQ